MKALRILALAFIFSFAGISASAQSRALGVRFMNGLEISYQHDFFPGFLEVDFGVIGDEFSGMRLTAAYDFTLYRQTVLGGGLAVYAGPAAHLGIGNSAGRIAGIGAQFGVEYLLPFVPIVLSVDFTPSLWSKDPLFAPRSMMPLVGIKWKL